MTWTLDGRATIAPGSARRVLICGAWLGPNEQVTWQTNVVNPGGQARPAPRLPPGVHGP